MNAVLLCFGVAWIGLALLIEAAPIWNICQAASNVQAGWIHADELFGPYNYPHTPFEALIFMPGFVALGWRQSRIHKLSV